MTSKSGFPYFEVQFTKTGDVFDQSEVRALKKHLADEGPSDLLVLAHGWNNDIKEARNLYDRLLAELPEPLAARGDSASITVLGLLWPSKKFADVELIASGAAGLSSAITDAVLLKQIEQLEQLLDDPESSARLE